MITYLLKELQHEQIQQQDKQMKEEKVMIKNCAPFTDCINDINNTQVHHKKNIDIVVMRGYNDHYSKTSGSLFPHHRDEPALNSDGNIADFVVNNATYLSKFKSTTADDDANIFRELLKCH